MTVQNTVGVTISAPSKRGPGRHRRSQLGHQSGRPLNTLPLHQIPNQTLLISGKEIPQRPAFNSVSTGSAANNRRATLVASKQSQAPARPVKSVTLVATGQLPQTGEITVGAATLVGLLLLFTLGGHLLRRCGRDSERR